MKEIRKAKEEGNDKTNWTMYVTLFRIIFLFKIQFISFFFVSKRLQSSQDLFHILIRQLKSLKKLEFLLIYHEKMECVGYKK